MFQNIGYALPLSNRLAMANLWLFEPLVLDRLLEQAQFGSKCSHHCGRYYVAR